MRTAPVWQVRVGTRECQLRDLPIGVLERISTRWAALLASPLVDLQAAEQLLHAAHDHLGVPRPRAVSARALLAAFTLAEDDLPTVWVDGSPEDAPRHLDAWIAALCRPPYSFTPRQIRDDFTARDLMLLNDAAESHDD